MALLEPSPESKHEKRTRVLFRVKETINNWLGVGMAYESIMKASDYIFNVGLTENHGLYLITTNGSNRVITQHNT